jgi:hypothetical protein
MPDDDRGPTDLTAILLPDAEHDAEQVRRAVAAGGYGDVWLRVQPLAGGLGLIQVEVFDGSGLPCADPAMVAALSGRDRRATFLHVNHQAGQALVHTFVGGKELEGWMGQPTELDGKLRGAVGRSLAEIVAGDDGSRRGIGHAASSTVALVRGRTLTVPAGTPTTLGSFGFHDRNLGAGGAGGDRLALVALDAAALRSAWEGVPGAELAARVRTLPDRAVGPLGGARDEAVSALAALGDATPAAAGLRSVRALELVALGETWLFGGGDAVAFIDHRMLPMFTLAAGEPPFDDPDEAEELETRASVLEAMVEVLPYGSPEGAALEQLEDSELRPLAPWARPGEEYVGALFLLETERLRGLLFSVDERDLAARIDMFYRSWWKAQTDDPLGDVFTRWRRGLDERGAADVGRFLTDWTEWRVVLSLAAANGLQPALVFYE